MRRRLAPRNDTWVVRPRKAKMMPMQKNGKGAANAIENMNHIHGRSTKSNASLVNIAELSSETAPYDVCRTISSTA